MKAAVSRLGFAPSAEEMRVDIETGLLEFTTRPGTNFDPAELRRAIEELVRLLCSTTQAR